MWLKLHWKQVLLWVGIVYWCVIMSGNAPFDTRHRDNLFALVYYEVVYGEAFCEFDWQTFPGRHR